MLDFEARTAAGVLIKTFASADQAAAWSEGDGQTYPGHVIERVKRFERREVIFRHQPERAAA